MQLGPTIDGRVKIVINDENDFAFFAELLQDAMGEDDTQPLVDQLARKGADEDWEEFVKPDLVEQFHQEKLKVGEVLAKLQNEEETEIFIGPENAQDWYSTLNQARLHLENIHKVSEMPDDGLSSYEPHEIQVKMKYDLYTQIQSVILEVVDY